MKNNMLVVLVLVAVVGGVVWYMKSSPAQPAMEQKETVQPATSSAGADADIVHITVEGTEFKFVSDTMKLKKGQKVMLEFKNTGKMPHDFVVDELGIRTKIIKGGETDVIEFTVDKVGTFESYCSVGSHRAQGMKGTVTVE